MDLRHELAKLIAERVQGGLRRKAVTSCSRWAEAYRVMGGSSFPGPWRFKHHPWLREMHDAHEFAETNVGMKAAQMGFSETMLNSAFYHIDVLGTDVLYVLPSTQPDARDFSTTRFGVALELSPHLRQLFSDTDNVGLKKAGTTSLYVRGSRSRSGLKSIPVGHVILDEVQEFDQSAIPLAMERMSGQLKKSAWLVSTPTIDGHGIHLHYLNSSQNAFTFPCPHCSKWIDLKWPDSVVITADDLHDPRIKDTHLICTECKGVLPHETKSEWLAPAKWVETVAGRDIKGWGISQLYSPAITPPEFVELFLQAKLASDKAAETEFYNSKLGLPHTVEGARLTEAQIVGCIGDYARDQAHPYGLVTMGVDIGTFLHYEVIAWTLPSSLVGGDINLFSQARVLTFGKVKDFADLDALMRRWNVSFAVVDAQPERRMALDFANRYYGRVRLCWYPNGISGRTLSLHDSEQAVHVDRTSWLDVSLGRFRRGRPWITVPNDLDVEYKTHLRALVRTYGRDSQDNPIGRYEKVGNDADHYAHAHNYAEIALPLAAGLGASSNITSPVL